MKTKGKGTAEVSAASSQSLYPASELPTSRRDDVVVALNCRVSQLQLRIKAARVNWILENGRCQGGGWAIFALGMLRA